MENIDLEFRLYSAASIPFMLMTSASIVAGLYSPKLLAFFLNRSRANKLIWLLFAAGGLVGATAVTWIFVTNLDFGERCLRTLFSLYSGCFLIGVLLYAFKK
jgi:hypothetical protein